MTDEPTTPLQREGDRRRRQRLALLELVHLRRGLDGPAAPAITDTDPDSPANDNEPEVKGTAGAGLADRSSSTTNADCTG